VYDITPKIPMAASVNDNAPKLPSAAAATRAGKSGTRPSLG